MPGARRFVRTVVRALALAPTMLMLMAGMAWADVQFTPAFSNTPGDANCTLHAPNTQCGQWTYWMAVGAIILGLVALVGFVVAYFRFAPRFQVQEPATAGGVARAGGARARPLEAPPPWQNLLSRTSLSICNACRMQCVTHVGLPAQMQSGSLSLPTNPRQDGKPNCRP